MKEIVFWLGAMSVFFIVFMLAFICTRLDMGILNIMPYRTENAVVMGFAILGIVKSIFEMR